MITKKTIIETLKKDANTRLEKRVLNIILNNLQDYNGTTVEKFDSIFSDYGHGCSTGVVTELIYYRDTERWFNCYRNEIIELLENDILEGLFEIKYIENEKEYFPVITFNHCGEYVRIIEYSNKVYTKKFNDILKNELAWYSFESCLFKFMNVYEGIKESQ